MIDTHVAARLIGATHDDFANWRRTGLLNGVGRKHGRTYVYAAPEVARLSAARALSLAVGMREALRLVQTLPLDGQVTVAVRKHRGAYMTVHMGAITSDLTERLAGTPQT